MPACGYHLRCSDALIDAPAQKVPQFDVGNGAAGHFFERGCSITADIRVTEERVDVVPPPHHDGPQDRGARWPTITTSVRCTWLLTKSNSSSGVNKRALCLRPLRSVSGPSLVVSDTILTSPAGGVSIS
ncbi:MAG: hypothetical protein JWM76_3570 [Pseudonocardiales bacterium]|nr:hypothetical protein [Pseudonocardiales bacterium]